jgi:predicted nuclease with TOPRIM domain
LIGVTFDEKLDEKLDIKLSHLPTKDEFNEQTGEIIKRLDNLEVEKDVLSHQVSRQEDRIGKIESHIGLTTD